MATPAIGGSPASIRPPGRAPGRLGSEEYHSAALPTAQEAAVQARLGSLEAGVKYPPTLILSADADDRVDPMHARKFAAALQAASTGGPVLLRIEKHSGHGGADLIKATIEKTADEYSFALSELGAPGARTTASK